MFAPAGDGSLLISQGIKEQVVVWKGEKITLLWNITGEGLDSMIKVSLLYV